MLSRSLLVLLNFCLLALAVADVPDVLLRSEGQSRSPSVLKKKGAITTKGADFRKNPKGTLTLFQHVELGGLKPTDGYLSHTPLVAEAVKHNPTGWLYYVDTTLLGLPPFIEVAAAYAEANRPYTHANEQEWSAHGNVPWYAVIRWQKLKDSKAVGSPTENPDYKNKDLMPASRPGSRAGSPGIGESGTQLRGADSRLGSGRNSPAPGFSTDPLASGSGSQQPPAALKAPVKKPATDKKKPATDKKKPATDQKKPATDKKKPAWNSGGGKKKGGSA